MARLHTTFLFLVFTAAVGAAAAMWLCDAPAGAPPQPARPVVSAAVQPAPEPSGTDDRSTTGSGRVGAAPGDRASAPRVAPRVAPPDVVVCGCVRDASGLPVLGAQVALWPRGAAPGVPARAVAGVDGRFRVQVVAALPFVAVLCAEGAATPLTVVDRCIAAPCVDVGDLVLAVGGALVGAVVATDGAPVGGAEVRLVAVTGALARLRGALRGGTGAAGAGAAAASTIVRTGADGAFAFRCLAHGAYAIEVDAAGCAGHRSEPIPVPPGVEAVLPPVVLQPGHQLSGLVLASGGGAAAGAAVCVTPRGGGGEPRRIATDTDGRFTIDRLDDGPLVVQVVAEGHAPLVRADVEPSPDLVIRLEPGARIRGVVTGREGARGGLEVRVRRVGDAPTAPVAVARQQLRARLDAANAALAKSPGDGPALAELAAVASARRELERRHALRAPFAPIRTVDVDRDGTFACGGLAGGIYTLEAVAAGAPGPTATEVVVVAGAEAFVALAAPIRPMCAAR